MVLVTTVNLQHNFAVLASICFQFGSAILRFQFEELLEADGGDVMPHQQSELQRLA